MNPDPDNFPAPEPLRLQPAPRPFADIRTFRESMAAMASTACLVTTQLGTERLGRTVTSTFSLSVEPPSVLVSIDMSSRLVDHIVKTGGFSFAMLALDQDAIADAFAGKVEPQHRFDTGRWTSWTSGHPRLLGAVAAMDCAVLGTVDAGTHLLVVGGVVDIDLASGRTPLIWQQRQYRALAGPNLVEEPSPVRA